ncbi:TetR/AcrR family transcriptional regulator [Parahaliea mediterranea]|uniref:TetR family transcriptional regulator n=1 Tax=Parahaliea mediterranea TaxID=651086 RepID=A0A939DEE4_9GAMM|nr:TetR/AcrR family transcriptional regulator [Parahaliea mediterranea]MBN7796594.1 TetR family transcriptional regulator [Parahaliea mediterranea]
MPKPSSRDIIIDTATRLLARRGLSVSIREINEAAGLSAAAVHYHFKNREQLINAVLRSRMPPFAEREGPIDALLAGAEPAVEDVVELLLAPLSRILLADPEGGRDYVRIIARLYSEQGEEPHFPLIEEFRSPVDKLMEALARALPGLPGEQLRLRYGFALEAMLNSLACVNFPVHVSSGEGVGAADLESLIAELKRFISAGFQAPWPS